MEQVFLDAGLPLTKRFELVNGQLVKHPYPFASRFTSIIENVNSIDTMHKVVTQHAALGHCLLKGRINAPLIDQSRAGATDSLEPTEWMCLDIDGLAGVDSPDDLVKEISVLRTVSYITQYSASNGIDAKRGLSAHLFFLLSEPVVPSALKDWLIHLNLTLPILRRNIRLSRTGMALRWPLDITTCQNDKLIYIAPPILGMGLKDNLKKRIELVKNRLSRATLDLDMVRAEKNKAEADKLLAELRAQANLPERKIRTRVSKSGMEIVVKPGECRVTSIKEERGFVYLNLNGGDSWGYFHPADNPEILYNFKNEPNYMLKELCPEYYARARRAQAPMPAQTQSMDLSRRVLAFLDPKLDLYFRGFYNTDTRELRLEQTASIKKLNDFLIENGQDPPETIPEWTQEFRFEDERFVDIDNRFINLYRPTELMASTKTRKNATVPPVVGKILKSICGDDEVIEHFMNWLAVIMQYRCKAETAWIFTGTQGTGKGLFFNRILVPIFGEEICAVKRLPELENPFNGYMEHCVLLLVDESKTDAVKNLAAVTSLIKNNITEPRISIRKMRKDYFMARSYLNWIITSNYPDPVSVDANDRRFNVAPHQDKQLRISDMELDRLKDELADFAIYLRSRKADRDLARTPLDNQARRDLISLSRSAPDVVADAILKGDLEFFIDQLPTGDTPVVDQFASLKLQMFKQVIDWCMAGNANLTRDQVRHLFVYCVDNVPVTPNKFTSFIKHHRLITKKIRIGAELSYGLEIAWAITPELKARWTRLSKPKLGRVK